MIIKTTSDMKLKIHKLAGIKEYTCIKREKPVEFKNKLIRTYTGV